MKQYRYILSINEGTPAIVQPLWDSGQALVRFRDEGNEFYRPRIDGSFIFERADFDLINDAAFESKFWLDLYSKQPYETDYGLEEFIGIFYKTDIEELDLDNKLLKVTPEVNDRYKPLLEGMEREFNLVDLAPPITPLVYFTQPVFQVYILGQSVITNILGGISFEQEVLTVPAGGGDLILNYNFGFIGAHGVVVGEDLDVDVAGEYIDETGAVVPGGSTLGWIRKSDGAYRVRYEDSNDPESDLQIVEVASGTVLYQGPKVDPSTTFDEWTLTSLTSSSQTRFILRAFYARYLTNENNVAGAVPVDIPADDIVSKPDRYDKVIGIGTAVLSTPTVGTSFENVIIAAGDHSLSPTQYGKFDAGALHFPDEYFVKPAGAGTGSILPIAQTRWVQASFWFQYDSVLKDLQEGGSTIQTVDCWLWSDVVQTLLDQIAPGVTHQPDVSHSDFLYSESNVIRGVYKTPVIVPKSVIIVGEGAEPPRRAAIRFSDIINQIRGWKCKWHLDGWKFVVESEQYYHNGGSYAGPEIGVDLTTFIEPKTRKPWTFRTNVVKYEKAAIPGQIRTGWMDETSKPFEGFPIEINSGFADKKQVEEIRLGVFNSDIDFMQIAPERVSKDGFFFGEAVDVDGTLTIPFVTLDLGNLGEYVLQNGYAAFIYMQHQYHIYVLPASDVNVNLENITAGSVKRTKIQELTIPADVIQDPVKLVTTEIGNGKLRSVSDQRDQNGAVVILEHDL